MKTNPNGQWTLDETSYIETFTKNYVERYTSELRKTEVSTFQRWEDKYILPRTLKDSLDKLLSKHLKPDYLDDKVKFNLMKSTYFDSASLDIVKHHVSKADSRFKLRTREYAPNGKLSKAAFTYLEVKAKHGGISDKFRIKVPQEAMRAFEKGRPIIPDVKLAKANPHIGMADLVKRVADINNAMTAFTLRPSCEISYVRKAYSDGKADDGLRVTYDENVKHKVLDVIATGALSKAEDSLSKMLNGYSSKDHIILEVKHHGTMPDFLTQFLNDNKVVKTQFSKYVYSMAKHTLEGQKG